MLFFITLNEKYHQYKILSPINVGLDSNKQTICLYTHEYTIAITITAFKADCIKRETIESLKKSDK